MVCTQREGDALQDECKQVWGVAMDQLRYDEVGYWSELKIEIIKEYASAYSRILSAKKLYHLYIDAFAGAGTHISRSTGEQVPGSPSVALKVNPNFREYHFIDLNKNKVAALRDLAGNRDDVFIYNEDCNQILIKKILPKVKFEDYRRALCILDPYGLHLNWEVIKEIGRLGTIDMFLNFPVADMNRNVLWRNKEGVSPEQVARMNAFWGDDSWNDIAYNKTQGLFFEMQEKGTNQQVAEGFRCRLKEAADFKHVPAPLPMKNSMNAIVYYLFFASNVPVANNIIEDIFKKYSAFI
jgi:three-Cys-motif partner protein